MTTTWKDKLLGKRTAGITVDLLEVIPHGGDRHLVVATIDGTPFREYVKTGDLRHLPPDQMRRAIAHRVRQMARPEPTVPTLTGREERIP